MDGSLSLGARPAPLALNGECSPLWWWARPTRADRGEFPLLAASCRSLLPGFARGIFGITRGLLIEFQSCICIALGNPRGVFPGLFFDDSVRLPDFLGGALCISQVRGYPFRVPVLRNANATCVRRFDASSPLLSRLRAVGQRRCPHLFQLRALCIGCRFHSFRKTWLFSGHISGFSFQIIRTRRMMPLCSNRSLRAATPSSRLVSLVGPRSLQSPLADPSDPVTGILQVARSRTAPDGESIAEARSPCGHTVRMADIPNP